MNILIWDDIDHYHGDNEDTLFLQITGKGLIKRRYNLPNKVMESQIVLGWGQIVNDGFLL